MYDQSADPNEARISEYLVFPASEFFSPDRMVLFSIWGVFIRSIFGTYLHMGLISRKSRSAKYMVSANSSDIWLITFRRFALRLPSYELRVKINMYMARSLAWGASHRLDFFKPRACSH